MNTGTYECFVPSNSDATGVDPAVTLGYRLSGQEANSDKVLSQINPQVTPADGGWRIVFSLLAEALRPFLPEWNNSDSKYIIAKRGLVTQIIVSIPEGVEESLHSVLQDSGSAAEPVKAHSKAIRAYNKTIWDEQIAVLKTQIKYKTNLPIHGAGLADEALKYSQERHISYELALMRLTEGVK